VQPRRSDFTGAVAALRDRLNRLLHRTITPQPLVMTVAAPGLGGARRMQLTFRQGGLVLARLQSRFGVLGLYVGQLWEARRDDQDGPPAVLMKYRYALHVGTDITSEPVVRWEFDRRPADPEATWSRRHLQGPVPLSFGPVTVSLNALHLPTGVVTLEDVIRFCVHDLGVPPLRAEWDKILIQSCQEPGERLMGGR
jgi:hypothetical protein